MKKQFNRMRQLANQTVGRAEKTEVLSDDLLQIERRLDSVRMVCHNSHKKLLGCLQGQPGTDTDKRFKKLPLMGVSQTMIDGCNMLNDDTLLVKTLFSCGEAEQRLAQELSQHEVQIEKDVLEPLNHLAEVEIPNIQKQRKQLAKLVLDWDSARTRYNQTQKSLGMQMQLGKMDSLKEEVDEAANKVEQCKDQLAADMYNFVSKEGEYGQYFVTLLEAQADYHRKALAVLEKALPEIQAQQDKWTEKPAFGTPLEEHLKRSGREIALPIEACVMMLLETGMKEEGLFRIAAGASKLKKLKAALDCSTSQLEEFYSDPHAVAGALKSYLRELPEPLMTFSLYDDWIQAGNISDPNSKLQALWMVCQKLPKPNQENFRYLVKFLAKLSQSSDVNKMTPSNIAIVLGPNLLWAKHEGTLAEIAAATSVHVVTIIEPIIQHADWFFPEEVDFNVSNAFVPVSTINQQNSVPDGQYEFGVMERKRPYSMAVVDGDFLKKEGISLKLFDGHLTSNSKRGGTLNRKHGSPPFQPPLPPTEASGQADYQSPPLDISAPASVASTDPVPTHVNEEASTFKPKEPPTSTTPPLLRNGGLQPSGGSASQLAAVPAAGAANPSPHSLRRATKKPAPAPPKPVAPLPVQPGNQGSPVSANTPPSVSPKPSGVTHSPASTAATASQGGTAPHPAYSHGSLPRRLSGSQPLIHAPSHPPPQPPTQPPAVSRTGSHPVAPAAEPPTTEQSPSPPHSPTPPDTPPLGVEQPGPPEVAQTLPPTAWTGTLTRGRPVPKPRIRPSVPPPPQPPGSHNTPEVPPMSSSKIITDPAALILQVQPGAESAAPPADAPPPQNPSTVENDIESTAL